MWDTRSSKNLTEKFSKRIGEDFNLKNEKFKHWDQEDLKFLDEANKIR